MSAERDARNLVQMAAREQRQLVASTRSLLVGLSKLPDIYRPTNPDDCRQTLVDVLRAFPYYRNVGVARADGEVVCRSHPNPIKHNISKRSFFIRAVQTRDFGVGDYQIGAIAGKSTINFAQVGLDPAGKIRIVIQAAFDLDWLNQLLAANELPPKSTLTVFDSRGVVVAHSPDPENWMGKMLAKSPLVQTILTHNGEGAVELIGPDGVNRIYAFSPLHDVADGRVYVTVGLSTDVAFAIANEAFRRNMAWLSAFAVIAFGLAWWVGNKFMLRRIQALAATAMRIGEGDFSARTGLPHKKTEEIGQLAAAFDHMASVIQAVISEFQRITHGLKPLSVGKDQTETIGATIGETSAEEMPQMIVPKAGEHAWVHQTADRILGDQLLLHSRLAEAQGETRALEKGLAMAWQNSTALHKDLASAKEEIRQMQTKQDDLHAELIAAHKVLTSLQQKRDELRARLLREQLKVVGSDDHQDQEASGPTLDDHIAEFEAWIIRKALEHHHGDINAVARELGLRPGALKSKIERYGLDQEETDNV